jgi:hypothetical protein
MSLNLGGTLFKVAWPGVKLDSRIQQKLIVTIDSIALHVLTYIQGKHKTIICCYTCVRILPTGTCIVHVQTRTLHDLPSIRESISLKWYPVMCPLSLILWLGISPWLWRYSISSTNCIVCNHS